jgi:NAD(P)-dependent dehydrogenase (short-subunit alcohol dehydrogenase family)
MTNHRRANHGRLSVAQRLLGRVLGAIVDPTIAVSFARPGFRIHALTFDLDDLRVELTGRRCLVTGGNSGLGYEAALALAHRGATVVLLCRNAERGSAAAAAMRAATGNPGVSAEVLDVSSLASVRAVAARLRSAPVDVLIHNAGLLPPARIETADGLELTFATHVVGPFLLTTMLRDALAASPDGRVIWVSSGGMYTQRLDLGDVGWHARPYDGVKAYAETKRAQVVLAELFAEELRSTGIVVNAMHPGWADTPGVRTSLPGFHRITESFLRTPAEGADTIVWLAASARGREQTGRFFFDREPRRTHLLPFTRETAEERAALWSLCERQAATSAGGRRDRVAG